MLNINYNTSQLPTKSIDLLKVVRKCQIKKIYRLLDWDVEDYIKTFKVKDSDLFSLGYGPIIIHLEDETMLAITSAENYKSLVLWKEFENIKDAVENGGKYDGCLIIDNENEKYSSNEWSEVSGASVEKIQIIKEKHKNIVDRRFPKERGIRLLLKGEKEIFITYGLCENAIGDLNILSECEVWNDLKDDLDYIEV